MHAHRAPNSPADIGGARSRVAAQRASREKRASERPPAGRVRASLSRDVELVARSSRRRLPRFEGWHAADARGDAPEVPRDEGRSCAAADQRRAEERATIFRHGHVHAICTCHQKKIDRASNGRATAERAGGSMSSGGGAGGARWRRARARGTKRNETDRTRTRRRGDRPGNVPSIPGALRNALELAARRHAQRWLLGRPHATRAREEGRGLGGEARGGGRRAAEEYAVDHARLARPKEEVGGGDAGVRFTCGKTTRRRNRESNGAQTRARRRDGTPTGDARRSVTA